MDTLEIKPGDMVKIYQKGRSPFEGVVIARRGGRGPSATFIVRAILDGVGVEKIYPLHSPLITKIELKKRAKVRRAKLYYLRTKKGKEAKIVKKQKANTPKPKKTETNADDKGRKKTAKRGA